MFPPESLPVEGQHLLAQLEGLVRAAGGGIRNRQVVHRQERIGMLRAVYLATEFQHLLSQSDRLIPAHGVGIESR